MTFHGRNECVDGAWQRNKEEGLVPMGNDLSPSKRTALQELAWHHKINFGRQESPNSILFRIPDKCAARHISQVAAVGAKFFTGGRANPESCLEGSHVVHESETNGNSEVGSESGVDVGKRRMIHALGAHCDWALFWKTTTMELLNLRNAGEREKFGGPDKKHSMAAERSRHVPAVSPLCLCSRSLSKVTHMACAVTRFVRGWAPGQMRINVDLVEHKEYLTNAEPFPIMRYSGLELGVPPGRAGRPSPGLCQKAVSETRKKGDQLNYVLGKPDIGTHSSVLADA
ncbi:hypothetical protein B0H19DRAFT_1078021 [Mycena capillaripes]|nr:hypothetical protein B0H19DRAFT_1078021 [Mycena capillaripes]